MTAISDVYDEATAIEIGMRAYRRIAAADLKENGVVWDIIPFRRWTAHQDEWDHWIVCGWQTALLDRCGDFPLASWKIGGSRLIRLI